MYRVMRRVTDLTISFSPQTCQLSGEVVSSHQMCRTDSSLTRPRFHRDVDALRGPPSGSARAYRRHRRDRRPPSRHRRTVRRWRQPGDATGDVTGPEAAAGVTQFRWHDCPAQHHARPGGGRDSGRHGWAGQTVGNVQVNAVCEDGVIADRWLRLSLSE